ncbi:MAG: hypothetical protein ABUL72_05685, partial [Armatimonadota bacterium]
HPDETEVEKRKSKVFEGTRALARSAAVTKFPAQVVTASWGGLVLREGEQAHEYKLDPSKSYPASLYDVESLGEFRTILLGSS